MRLLPLWLLSFAVGAAVMVVEIAGARLLAPTYGISTVPWTGVIAGVLLGVALGNAWGGRRSGDGSRLLSPLLLGAGGLTLLPLFRGGLPELLLAGMGPAGGVVASSLLLFFPPAFLLGAAAPILVRMGTRHLGEVGRKTGLLNGANALGAIAGTLATGFLLVPFLPLAWLLAGAGLSLCALAWPAWILARTTAP